MSQSRSIFHPELGRILLVGSAETGLTELTYITPDDPVFEDSSDTLLDQVEMRLDSYFKGKQTDFSDLPLNPQGTLFQQHVWRTLLTIPWGETRSYKWLAEQVGNPKASRAVGMANGRNPIPILIPCHRVIQQDGALGGYTGGLDIKRYLLGLESHPLGDSIQQSRLEFALTPA